MDGIIKLSLNIGSGLYEYANDVKNAKLDMKNLGEEIKANLSILTRVDDLLKSQSGSLQATQELRPALDANLSELNVIKLQLAKEQEENSSIRKRILNKSRWSSQKRNIEYDMKKLRKTREDIESALNVDTT
ncbi:hypothetical protein ACHAPE_008985 [Trichoderma viride]